MFMCRWNWCSTANHKYQHDFPSYGWLSLSSSLDVGEGYWNFYLPAVFSRMLTAPIWPRFTPNTQDSVLIDDLRNSQWQRWQRVLVSVLCSVCRMETGYDFTECCRCSIFVVYVCFFRFNLCMYTFKRCDFVEFVNNV